MELTNIFKNVIEYREELLKAFLDTLLMVGISGIISFVIGIPLGVILNTTNKDGLLENLFFYKFVNRLINILRSIPFVILIAAIIPITRFIVGTTIGLKGAIVPLVIASSPFVARQIEGALQGVSYGVIEAAESMGSSKFEIINRVLLVEGMPGIIHALVITTVNLIGFSAIAGTVGGGGLGDFAIRYGYQYFKTDLMVVTVIILIVIISIIQWLGDLALKRLRH